MGAAVELSVRALLLDMDGTLVNSDAAVERVWRRWAASHGLDGDLVMKVAHGRQGYSTMALMLPDRPTSENYADNTRLLAEETADTDGVVAVPGASEFLASLRDVPHALVTSADVGLSTARMAAAGLTAPEIKVTAEDVAVSKPDPEGFLKAAAELGIAPEDCLVFEDSEAGIAAGKAAGMRVVGIGPRARAYAPDVVVPDLRAIRVSHAADGSVLVRAEQD
ncbi:HAD-IA family hydrolase [Streptomyces sp. NPDC056600]|uniref:HAD-IA family hydrolase n=1 Tax=Streptomyces sp. NPDC056600 TaxID=3345874 RepID=UPI0036BBFC03